MRLKDDESPELNTPWQARLPFYYGWVIVSVVFLRGFVTAGTLWVSLGVLAVPMHEDLGWSRTVIFAGMSVRTLGAAMAGLVFGKYLDLPGGPRFLGVLSGIAAGIALFGTALVQEPWQFLLIFGLVGGFLGTGPAALMMGAVVPKWFVRRRGRAVATATMGTGLAGFLLSPLVAVISEALGWRLSWAALGVLVLIIAALPGFLLITQPEDVGLEPDGDSAETPQAAASRRRLSQEVSFTAAQAFRTRTLWLLVAVAIFGGVTNSAYPANIVLAYVERGFSASEGAVALSGYGLFSFASRFGWGYLADKLHVRQLLLMVAIYTGSVVPLFLVLPGDSLLIAGALTGAGTGGWVALSQLVWGEYFGRANLGAIVGKTRPLITLFGAAGPIYIAGLADLTGSYSASIGMFALSWGLCAFFLLLVRPPVMPSEANPETASSAARS